MPPLYRKLNENRAEIRVLQIKPAANFDEPIRCSLLPISLDNQQRPKYEALSYVWGNSTEKRPVWVNKQRCEIGVSLETALRRLRRKTGKRIIWADALCINQDDEAEKNIQVPLMGKIYSLASKVVLWLGEDATPAVEVGFRWLAKHEQWQEMVQKYKFTKAGRLVAQQAYRGLGEVLMHVYWSRMWTFQEFLLAPRRPGGRLLMWGAHECDDVSLVDKARSTAFKMLHLTDEEKAKVNRDMSKFTREDLEDVGLALKAADQPDKRPPGWGMYDEDMAYATQLEATGMVTGQVERLWLEQPRSGTGSARSVLRSLLYDTAGRACANPRDKVYALYGLLPAAAAVDEYEDIKLPAIDYSMSERELFWRAVAFTLPGGAEDDVLGRYLGKFLLFDDRLTTSKVPSWVPDLTSNVGAGTITATNCDSPGHYVPVDRLDEDLEGFYGTEVRDDGRSLRVWGRSGPCRVLTRIVPAPDTGDKQEAERRWLSMHKSTSVSARQGMGVARAVHALLNDCADEGKDDGGRTARRLRRALLAHSDAASFRAGTDEGETLQQLTELVTANIENKKVHGEEGLTKSGRFNLWDGFLDGLHGKTLLETTSSWPRRKLSSEQEEISLPLLGMSVAAVQDGDVVALVPDLWYPALLRPVPGNTNKEARRYRLVGLAYIEGAMGLYDDDPDSLGLIDRMKVLPWESFDII